MFVLLFMEGSLFIQDLAMIAMTAGLAGWLCRKAKLSVVVGYLLAGVLIGPSTDPIHFVTDGERIQVLSDMGLVFLMFCIGLGSGLRRMRALGMQAIFATGLGALFVVIGARLLGNSMGPILFGPMEGGSYAVPSLFFAAMLVASSSAIIGKVLHEVGAIHKPFGQKAMGVTVLEDFVAVIMLTILSSYTSVDSHEVNSVGSQMSLFIIFVVCVIVLGVLFIPRLLKQLNRSAEGEIGTLLVVGLVFSLAVIAYRAGYSLALGAFILGVIIGDTPQKGQVERIFLGLRDLFSAVFFVSIGMLIEVSVVIEAWPVILFLAAFTIFLRTAACTLAQILVGNGPREAIQSGLSLTPTGEFSFIIAQMGVQAAILPSDFFPIAVGISTLTAFVAPFLIQRAEWFSEAVVGRMPQRLLVDIQFYHEMSERLILRQAGNVLWQLSRTRLFQIVLTVLVVTGMFVFSSDLSVLLESVMTPHWVSHDNFIFLFWSGLGLVAAAPVVAIWRNVDALGLLYAEVLSKGIRGKRGQQVLRFLLHRSIQFSCGFLMTLWLVSIIPLGAFTPPILGLIVLVVVGGIFLFWRKLIRWQSQLEYSVRTQFEEPILPAKSALDWKEHGKWDLILDDCELSEATASSGKSLGDLDLRAQSGASIVGIDRGGVYISSPGAEQVLYPGDRLLLVGNEQQIKIAEDLLLTSADLTRAEELERTELDRIRVSRHSPYQGQTMRQMAAGEKLGVIIIGIKRGTQQILNPGADEVLQQGDILLVAGVAGSIQIFAQWLSPEPCA